MEELLTAPFRLAVISDIHMHDGSHVTESFARINPAATAPRQDPFLSLQELIATSKLEADVLACLGDIADQADPAAAIAGWDRVRDVGDRLGRADVIATTGNHDVDSRRIFDAHDPTSTLRFQLSDYPVADEFNRYKYWARNYCILDYTELDTRVVLLNTSSLHLDEKVAQHGTVSTSTLGALEQELSGLERRDNNILLCHHHPYKHGDLDLDDYSEIDNAAALVDLLDQRLPDAWCVVHGHKHLPRVAYAGTGNQPLTVFSAGSFSGPLYPEISHVGHQFYILEFSAERARQLQLSTAVRFRSWTWRFASGWAEASQSRVPARGGFGLRASTPQLIGSVRNLFDGNDSPFLTWEEVLSALPQLEFLAPRDLEDLIAGLGTAGLGVVRDGPPAPPLQIGRPA